MTKLDARYVADLGRVLAQYDDPHPSWVWADDGRKLVWRNRAALAFKPKLRRKLGADLVPVGRQIARALRLSTAGTASLSRMQFTVGHKPISATCLCTPVMVDAGNPALLVVGVDPVDVSSLEEVGSFEPPLAGLMPRDVEWVLRNKQQGAIAASANGLQTIEATAVGDIAVLEVGEARQLLLAAASAPLVESPEKESAVEVPGPALAARAGGLSTLLDQLAGDSNLYAPLGEEDDAVFQPAALEKVEEAPAKAKLWRVVARRFTPLTKSTPDQGEPMEIGAPTDDDWTSDEEEDAIARTSRYNFDELSRILNDRIGDRPQPESPSVAPAMQSGALVSLGDENLLLNRLPLGLLVFRDQEILFANRAFAELVKYPDTATLRQAGLAAIFPNNDESAAPISPVGQLLTRGGEAVPVSARLQSIGWQGKPALLLSARQKEDAEGHEAAIKSFARDLAHACGDGFFESTAAGIVSSVSEKLARIYDRTEQHLIGRPVHGLVALESGKALRAFLEHAGARQANKRPMARLAGSIPGHELFLFAERSGNAVTGYFGLVRAMAGRAAPKVVRAGEGVDADVLARVSRDIRDPLNSIVGFSNLIGDTQTGDAGDTRASYMRDIRSAGADITGVLDELDEFARLKRRDFAPEKSDFDLGSLLDRAVARVRGYAGRSRVLVRSSIALSLPRITADEPSLSQAVLNLLASAIDQTPPGGQVVVSARQRFDGAVEVHIRDSAARGVTEMEKRFVMFRDGTGPNGEALKPIRSSVGLPLTRSLLAVNSCALTLDPTPDAGTLISLVIPAELAVQGAG